MRHPSREVPVLHNLVNQVRLQKLDIPVGQGLNVDSDVVTEGPLIFNVKLGSDLCDYLVDCCVSWGIKDPVVQIDNNYDFALIEHVVVQPGLSESYYSSPLARCWFHTIDTCLRP